MYVFVLKRYAEILREEMMPEKFHSHSIIRIN